MNKQSIIKPPPLRQGDTIGFVAPASRPDDLTRIEKAAAYFDTKGFNVITGKHIKERRGYLAGTDAQRLEDLRDMFADDRVKAILCLRGGYGAPRLLPMLPYELIRRNPKIFCGYSDVTSLHSAILAKTGLVTFAGPMAAVDFWSEPVPYTEEIFYHLLCGNAEQYTYPLPEPETLTTIIPGTAEGWLFGGNTAVLCGILGSPYVPDLEGAILYLEDVDEPPYRLDRFFNQLRLSGAFEKINGILLGQFSDCVPPDVNKPSLAFDEVLADYFSNLAIPVLSGFPHGHIKKNATLPHGIKVELNATDKSVTLLENCVG